MSSHGVQGPGHGNGRALGHVKHGSGKFKAKGGSGEKKALEQKPGSKAEEAAGSQSALADLDRAIAAIRTAVANNAKDSSMGVSAPTTSRLANPLPANDQYVGNEILARPSGGAPADAGVKSGGGVDLNRTGGGGLAGGVDGLE